MCPCPEDASGGPVVLSDEPLSAPQQRIWFELQQRPGDRWFHRVWGWRVDGPFDPERFARALAAVVAETPSLRQSFLTREGSPVRRILPAGGPMPWSIEVVSGVDSAEALREAMERRARWEVQRGLDLAAGPGWSVICQRAAPGRHGLVLVGHQLVMNAEGVARWWQALASRYSGSEGETQGIDANPPRIAPESREPVWSSVEWRLHLHGAKASIDWIPEGPSGLRGDPHGARFAFAVSAERRGRLASLAAAESVAEADLHLALWQVLVHRQTGDADLVIGVPVAEAGEGCSAWGGLNLLPARSRWDPDRTWRDFLGATAVAARARRASDRAGHMRILQVFREEVAGAPGGFPSLFAWEPTAGPRRSGGAIRIRPVVLDPGTVHVDFALGLIPEGADGGLQGWIEYRPGMLAKDTVRRWITRWQALVEAVLADPAATLGALPIAGEGEEAEVLESFNDTQRDYPRGERLHDFLSRAARSRPDAVALVDETGEVTHRELEARSSALAARLQEAGAAPETVVGVLVPRSRWLATALFGVLKAGAAYLPLDPEQPASRNAMLLADSQAVALVLGPGAAAPDDFTGAVLRLPETAPDRPAVFADEVHERNLAYVIYTSGSTGRPKGVMVEHRSIVNRLRWMEEAFPMGPETVFFQQTRATFDVSVVELFMWSVVGARLVLPGPGVEADPMAIRDWVRRAGVTVIHFVPAMLGSFLTDLRARGGEESLASLRLVYCSGEALPGSMVREFFGRLGDRFGIELFNLYGPTEAAVEVTAFDCREYRQQASVPIGRPVANTRLYVLDASARPLPVGVVGELHLGGIQVARGYLRRPELTAKAFIPDSFVEDPDARLYKTGDLARWRGDGTMEYLGRNDFQIKIRGVRIEPGEIEAVLVEAPTVAEVAVLARPGPAGDLRLFAYVRGEMGGPRPDPEALRGWLGERLPAVMVPAAVVVLEAFPVNASGKLDRKALPEPSLCPSTDERGEPPRREDPVEERVTRIWEDVLESPVWDRKADFFASGGHSLLAVALVARVSRELSVDVMLAPFLRHPNLAGLVELVRASSGREGPSAGAEDAPAPGPPAERARLTAGQRRMWFQHQLDESGRGHNIVLGMRLRGAVRRERLEGAVRALLEHHRGLRTVVREEDGELWQIVRPTGAFAPWLPTERARRGPVGELEADYLAREDRMIFDLREGPLFRARLVSFSRDRHLLLLSMHHLVADEVSTAVLLEDLGRFYHEAESPGRSGRRLEITDLAAREHSANVRERAPSHRAWWRGQLSQAPLELPLPFDHPLPETAGFVGARERSPIGVSLRRQLEALLRETGTTPFLGFLAAWGVFLGRLSNRSDLLIGVPVSLRDDPALERTVGFLLNTLPYRLRWRPGDTFRTLLSGLREQSAEIQRRAEYPFENIVSDLGAPRTAARAPVYQAMCVPSGTALRAPRLDGLEVALLDHATAAAKVDLTLHLQTLGDDWRFELEYRRDVFEASTIVGWTQAFEGLLRELLAHPDEPLPGSSGGEAGASQEANTAFTDSIVAQLEAAAASAGAAEALRSRRETWTHRQLREAWSEVARALQARGVGRGDRVVWFGRKRPEAVVAILGILRSGAAYVPLDADYPPARSRAAAEDAVPALILAAEDCCATAAGWSLAPVVTVGELRAAGRTAGTEMPPLPGAADLAYLIYTSGSTGRPKGVMVTHANLAASNSARASVYGAPPRRFLHLSSLAFDSSVAGLFWTLCGGGCLMLPADDEARDPSRLLGLLGEGPPATVLTVPGFHREMLEAASHAPAGLDRVVLAGETLPPRLVRRHFDTFPEVELWNEYGPTEATVWATAHRVAAADADASVVPVGRPWPGAVVTVRNAHGHSLPPGERGEIWIEGPAVAAGYWRDAQATRVAFEETGAGTRAYRTGDAGRMRSDGTLEFLGRDDRQVKIHGIRIELEEVESLLRRHPAVQEAVAGLVVVGRNNGNGAETMPHVRLRAILEAAPGSEASAEAGAVRAWLGERLPAPAIPELTWMHRLPRLPNGKVDRRVLGETGEAVRASSRDPGWANEAEAALGAVWEEVLPSVSIGRNDDFFALGGDSLSAMRVVTRARQRGFELGVGQLFAHPTVAELAAVLVPEALSSGHREAEAPKVVAYRASGTARARLLAVHGIEGYGIMAGRLAARRPAGLEIIGIEAPAEPADSIPETARHYLAALPPFEDGVPLFLAGYCFGAAVAFEMARQLEAAGRSPARVIIVDAALPRLNEATIARVLEEEGLGGLCRRAWGRLRRRLPRFARPRATANAGAVPTADPDYFGEIAEDRWAITRMHIAAIVNYVPGDFAGDVTVIRTPPESSLLKEDLGWRRVVRGDLRLHLIETTHSRLVKEPAVAELAALVWHEIDEARPGDL